MRVGDSANVKGSNGQAIFIRNGQLDDEMVDSGYCIWVVTRL